MQENPFRSSLSLSPPVLQLRCTPTVSSGDLFDICPAGFRARACMRVVARAGPVSRGARGAVLKAARPPLPQAFVIPSTSSPNLTVSSTTARLFQDSCFKHIRHPGQTLCSASVLPRRTLYILDGRGGRIKIVNHK